MGRCPPAVTMDAAALVASLHARLLRGIADEYGIHFQGLRAAAGHLRRAGIVTPRMAKRLTNVDIAFNIGRHITSISADAFFSEVLGEKRERALINQSATLPCTMDLLRTGVASSGSSTVFALDSDEERLARAPIRFDMFDVDEFRTAATQTDGLIWSGYLDGGGCRVDGGALCGGFHGDSGGVLSDGGCFHEDGGVLSDGWPALPSLVVNEWPALPAWPLSCALVVAPTAPASSTESTAVVSSASVGIAGLTLEEHTAPRASKGAELERAELAVLELALLASDDEETSSACESSGDIADAAKSSRQEAVVLARSPQEVDAKPAVMEVPAVGRNFIDEEVLTGIVLLVAEGRVSVLPWVLDRVIHAERPVSGEPKTYMAVADIAEFGFVPAVGTIVRYRPYFRCEGDVGCEIISA